MNGLCFRSLKAVVVNIFHYVSLAIFITPKKTPPIRIIKMTIPIMTDKTLIFHSFGVSVDIRCLLRKYIMNDPTTIESTKMIAGAIIEVAL